MEKTTLLMLPGLDGTEILFGPLIAHLPDWIEPVVVEYPQSGSNTYEEMIAFVDEKAATFGSFATLGNSFGGPLALMLAARRPSQVTAVILAASFVTPPRPEWARLRRLVSTPVIGALRTFRRVRYWVPGFAEDDLRRAKAELWRRVGARVLAARSRAVLSVDVRSELERCRARLMYLAHLSDTVVPRRCADEVSQLAPSTHVVEVEGSHLGLFTHPAPSAACLAEFLAGR